MIGLTVTQNDSIRKNGEEENPEGRRKIFKGPSPLPGLFVIKDPILFALPR
jgi:hypothetical protein